MAATPIHFRGFWISLVSALVAYAAGISTARNAVAVFLPLVLLAGLFCNAWFRSLIIGWLLFTTGFVCWMIVLGAFTLRWRMEAQMPVALFARALVLYGMLAMAGLYQLKPATPPSPPAP